MTRPQLRFERHPCVHQLYLNMWGWRNHSNGNAILSTQSFCQPLPPNQTSSDSALYKSAHPTLVYVCTHESLSNLRCETLHFLPPSPIDIATLGTLPVLCCKQAMGLLSSSAPNLNPLLLLLVKLLLYPAAVTGQPPRKVDISTPGQ